MEKIKLYVFRFVSRKRKIDKNLKTLTVLFQRVFSPHVKETRVSQFLNIGNPTNVYFHIFPPETQPSGHINYSGYI